MNLAFGDISVSLNLPEGRLLAVIQPSLPASPPSTENLIATALARCAPLLDRFQSGERAVIVTSDITRYTGSAQYLPLLVDEVNRRGIPDRNITILIALGIHRRQTEAEHRRIVGALYDRVTVADHDCDNPGKLISVGRTTNGIDVEVNRLAVETDRLILTGTIGFHYFAGFGGGRKALLPGISGRASCLASHFAVLHPLPGAGRHPLATTGVLDGNPVHEAMTEACAMVGPDLILNTVLSPNKKLLAVFAGQWEDEHRAGCRFYAEHFSYPLQEKADLVVASCGGYPKDINLIQSHKAMEYASRALKEGGVMILMAQCRDGYGHPTFFTWFRHKEMPEFEAALRARYEINGQTAYALLDKAKRFRIILVSDLPPEEVKAMSLIPAATLDAAVQKAETLLPAEYTTYVIPEAGTVLPVCEKTN